MSRIDEPTSGHVVPAGLAPIAIVGVTASGKSGFAMELARRRGDVELVSIDSMQVYRGMDLGTAKPTSAERAEIPHHLLDVVEPSEDFDVARFQAAVAEALADIASRGRRAVLVGGTGLYLRAVVDALEIPGRFPEVAADLDREPDTERLHRRLSGLDPTAASRVEPTNRRRIIRALEVTIGSGRAFSSFGPGLDSHPETPVAMVGIRRDRTDLVNRIRERFESQMASGLLDEVRHLHAGPAMSRTAARALGYRELLDLLDRLPESGAEVPETRLTEAVETAIRNITRFAKRQERWFRRDPRITWIDPDLASDHLRRTAERRWGPS